MDLDRRSERPLARPHRPRRLRASGRRVAGVRRHAGAAGRCRRARRADVRLARRERIDQRSVARPRRRSGAGPHARVAGGGRDSRHHRPADPRSSRRRSPLGPRAAAARRDRRRGRALPARRRDHVCRGRLTGIWITSACTSAPSRRCDRSAPGCPPLYYVAIAPDTMRDVVDAAHAQGRRAARLELLGHRAGRVRRRREAADLQRQRAPVGARGSWRRCAATGRRWGATTRSPGSARTRRAAASASSISAAQALTRTRRARSARRTDPGSTSTGCWWLVRRETLDILRCP